MKWGSKLLFGALVTFCVHYVTSTRIYAQQNITLSFSKIYPASSLKNFVSMTMRVWTAVNALQKNQSDDLNQAMVTKLAHEILLLNSTVDSTLIETVRSTRQCNETLSLAQDIEYLKGILENVFQTYSAVVESYTIKHVACAASLFILESILYKLTLFTNEEKVPAALERLAHSHHTTHSIDITPLSVPTIIYPEAPIACTQFARV